MLTVEALYSSDTRSSVTMVKSMQEKWVLVFQKEEFQLPASSKFLEMIENENTFYVSLNTFSIKYKFVCGYIRLS